LKSYTVYGTEGLEIVQSQAQRALKRYSLKHRGTSKGIVSGTKGLEIVVSDTEGLEMLQSPAQRDLKW